MDRYEYDVLGIGNAIVDVLMHVEEDFLVQHKIDKGVMTLIEADEAEYFSALVSSGTMIAGGSAANTIAGLAHLGGSCAFIGKVNGDSVGVFFQEEMYRLGIHVTSTSTHGGDLPTGRAFIFITPDAQRSMCTFLGISVSLTPRDIERRTIQGSAVTYLEGYLWDRALAKQAFLEAAEVAHTYGRQVALSLSDPLCVARHRRDFQTFLSGHIDILFANREEILHLYEVQDVAEVIPILQQVCPLSVITQSAEPVIVVTRQEVKTIPTQSVPVVVDTTGAGDQFAAGFFYGLTRQRSLEECAHIGTMTAAEVITHDGARLQQSFHDILKKYS